MKAILGLLAATLVAGAADAQDEQERLVHRACPAGPRPSARAPAILVLPARLPPEAGFICIYLI